MGAPIFPEIWVRGVPIFRGTHISVTPVSLSGGGKGSNKHLLLSAQPSCLPKLITNLIRLHT